MWPTETPFPIFILTMQRRLPSLGLVLWLLAKKGELQMDELFHAYEQPMSRVKSTKTPTTATIQTCRLVLSATTSRWTQLVLIIARILEYSKNGICCKIYAYMISCTILG